MESTVEEAIQSVLVQKGTSFEIIIVNDGSNDTTPKILDKFSSLPNVTVIHQSHMGKNIAFNNAYRNAKGAFFVLFAADDIMPETSLAVRQELLFSARSKMAYSCGKIRTFSESSTFNNLLIPRKKNIPNFSGGAGCFPKSLGDLIFPLPEILPNEDTWLRLVINKFATEILVTNEVVLQYRIYAGNSIKKTDSFEVFSNKLHDRHKALKLFWKRYKVNLTHSDKTRLLNRMKLEEARYQRDISSLLFCNKSPLKAKLTSLFYSKPFLYKIKNILFKYLAGWNS